MKKQNLLFHPLFLVSLCLLLLNDFFWKHQYHNAFTGKISDFTGLIVFVFFFATFIPRGKKWISIITAILFILWKTELADSFISFFNSLQVLEIARVLDYSDWLAIIVLPVCHFIINEKSPVKLQLLSEKVAFGLIAIVATFAITSTSKASFYCQPGLPSGSIALNKSYKVKGTVEEVKHRLGQNGFSVLNVAEASPCYGDSIHYLQIPSAVVYYTTMSSWQYNYADTLININFNINTINKRKSSIQFINATIPNFKAPQDWKKLKEITVNCNYALKRKLIVPLR